MLRVISIEQRKSLFIQMHTYIKKDGWKKRLKHLEKTERADATRRVSAQWANYAATSCTVTFWVQNSNLNLLEEPKIFRLGRSTEKLSHDLFFRKSLFAKPDCPDILYYI